MENIENLGNAEKSLKDEKTAEKEETGRGTKKEGNGVKKDLRGKESKSLGISVKDERELSVKEKIKKYLPVAIFLPLIILMGSDAAILLVNQVLVQIEFNLGHNFKIIGMIVGLSLLSQAVSTMIFGYLADKYSRKKILLIGASIWSFGEIMVYLTPTPNIAWLLIFRLLASAGAGSSTPVTMSILGDIFSAKKRGMSFAWWGLASTIGGLGGGSIATAFNPIFGDSSYNNLPSLAAKILYISETYPMEVIDRWRIPFLIMGLLGIIFTILILFVKEPKRGSSEVELKDILENTDIDYSNSYKIKLSDLKIIYQRKSNFWLIFNFVDTIFSGLILGFAITWLTIEVGLDFKPDTIGAVLPFVLILAGGILFGQFYFPKLGDKKVKNGDYAGRAKVAIMCGVVHIVFLIIGFGFYPNFGAKTFFKGALDLSSDPVGFEIMVIIDAIIIAIGLAFEFGISPTWYASMIDVNLPEHRASMIAAASFMDSIGRAIGAWLGGAIIDYYNNIVKSPMPITDTIMFSTLTFGLLSAAMWLPILKYAEHDFTEVHVILQERRKELEKRLNAENSGKIQNNSASSNKPEGDTESTKAVSLKEMQKETKRETN